MLSKKWDRNERELSFERAENYQFIQNMREGKKDGSGQRKRRTRGASANQNKEGGCEQTFGLCALFVDGLLQGAAEDFVTLSTKGGPFTPYIRRVDGVLP